MVGRKFSSPDSPEVETSVTTWADCSLLCQARSDCTGWAWQSSQSSPSSTSCTTMTGWAGSEEAEQFVSGARDCHTAADIAGWLTCQGDSPYQAVSQNQRHEVRLRGRDPSMTL